MNRFRNPLVRKEPLIYLLILILGYTGTLKAQTPFNGSFLMSFYSISKSNDDFPLLWQIEPAKEGGRMVMEIKDEMEKKGVFKRVLFNPNDSTWTMLMEVGNMKQGTRIHRSMMYRDSIQQQKIKITTTAEKRIIDNYPCKKIIRESKNYYAEIWMTDKIDFNMCKIYYLLSHCGMMSDSMRKGDWFFWKRNKGMILQVTSRNKLNGESYTMSISHIQPGIINRKLFITKGFRISDIPEGQNCGVAAEEK